MYVYLSFSLTRITIASSNFDPRNHRNKKILVLSTMPPSPRFFEVQKSFPKEGRALLIRTRQESCDYGHYPVDVVLTVLFAYFLPPTAGPSFGSQKGLLNADLSSYLSDG